MATSSTLTYWAPHLIPDGLAERLVRVPSPVFAGKTRPTMSFFNLPRELRDKIYAYLIPHQLCFTMKNQCRQRDYWAYGHVNTETFSVHHYLAEEPVMLINRQFRDEMLDKIYEKTIFCFEWRRRANFIVACLQSLPDSAKARIRCLSWKKQSLHTGNDPQTVKGWSSVMDYVAAHFTSLRVIHCHSPSGEDGRHRYHNWEVPRLAANMLANGRIEELRWFWKGHIYYLEQVPLEVKISIALRLLTIPYDKEKDGKVGYEYRRLQEEPRYLNTSDPVDEWAIECLMRPKHRFVVEKLQECLVLRRG
ncbi:hypothetical protein BU23DRAFT_551201 [Bimuria novae-zelandiae CBS 107.79]|uniref:F-box domain-containing protein n=1 Tax=Bimuria novae-zelandiae CBS 107.79 TaxID=1447943 RepID=A0A6A5VJ75_9PLEO|nr:hypothetical protein BU23DRAFT_551201 [Bimuria novae-zelandiae CBS 107.79]